MKCLRKTLGIIAFIAIIGSLVITCEEEASEKTKEDGGGFAFELISGNTEYSISLGSAKASGEITLPASYKGLPVTAIANNAFSSCVNMTGVTIPNKVTKIGENAFQGCTSLVRVTFTSTITESDFSFVYPFPGDLRDKYLAADGGIGIYTRANGDVTTWVGAPDGLKVSAATTSSITLDWISFTGATRYKIYRSASSTGTFTEAGTSTTTSFTDSGLTAGTAYYYKVAAIYSNGASSQSNAISAVTVPGIPAGVTTAAASFNIITVNWSSVTGAAGYRIYRSTSSTGTFTEVGTSTTTSFSDSGLTASTTYYYRVAAYNSGGTGEQSNTVNVTTLSQITIDTQPAAMISMFTGKISGSLSVSASVTPGSTLSYQWYSNTTASNNGGNIINGATDSSYSIPTSLEAGIYYYFVEIRATGGAVVRSNVATVGVISVEMVWINSGTFTMGSPTNEANRGSDETQHDVTISKGFNMGKYEVTQELYQAVMGVNPSIFTSNPATGEVQERRPVESVTWYDAVEFCNKLSEMEGLTKAYKIIGATVTVNWETNGYRLPTEAEWEYACRAGMTTAYNTGDTISDNTGWYTNNSNSRTHEVGKKSANAWGLYDMQGNVWEWCWDWYGSYASESQTDPRGAASGSSRVLRGGGWDNFGQLLRSAFRDYNNPDIRGDNDGFRLLRP